MRHKNLHSFIAVFLVFLTVSAARAQRSEIAVTLNESFFNALVDSVFNNFDTIEFPIAKSDEKGPERGIVPPPINSFGFTERVTQAPCGETIRVLRESGGVRTSVRIREGRIFVPLAFSGTYSPPFVGCVEFAGWADTSIDLEFDRDGQRLVGHATVASVNLNGAGGVGGAFIAKMMQRSLDQKMNPLEILRLDKLSFAIPIQNSGNLRLRAVGARPELSAGSLTLHIEYEFLKG